MNVKLSSSVASRPVLARSAPTRVSLSVAVGASSSGRRARFVMRDGATMRTRAPARAPGFSSAGAIVDSAYISVRGDNQQRLAEDSYRSSMGHVGMLMQELQLAAKYISNLLQIAILPRQDHNLF
eukprot:5045876-Pleurochrysis_carterae.AAC.1